VADAYFSEFIKDDRELRGIKDVPLFLSALNEPKQTFDCKDLYSGPLEKAAAYMRSIVMNHPFHDGNKRTAMMAGIIFLEENGYKVTVPNKKLYRLALTIVNKKPTPTIHRITRTLKKYTKENDIKQKQGRTMRLLRFVNKIAQRKQQR